jgi:hydroxymethylpyrimidine/phosphomethylpyrimidine kinase
MVANILSIAGTDPTAGAGIQADLKTFSALGCYGLTVVTSIVAQNTLGVKRFEPVSSEMISDQLDAVFEDVRIDAVKIGMVANAKIAAVIVDRLKFYKAQHIVLDPVMIATSHHSLIEEDAVDAIKYMLIPMSTIMTPNLPEAGMLLNTNTPKNIAQMHDAIGPLLQMGSGWVLLKGGHLSGDECVDLLGGPSGISVLRAPRVRTKNDHGTGCTLSAALASFLPFLSVEESAQRAKTYLTTALIESSRLQIGRGHGPVHHFHLHW